MAFVNFEDDNIVIPFVGRKASRTVQTGSLFLFNVTDTASLNNEKYS
jgi:hypothetical protein